MRASVVAGVERSGVVVRPVARSVHVLSVPLQGSSLQMKVSAGYCPPVSALRSEPVGNVVSGVPAVPPDFQNAYSRRPEHILHSLKCPAQLTDCSSVLS